MMRLFYTLLLTHTVTILIQRENFRALLSYMSDRGKAAVITLPPLEDGSHSNGTRNPGEGFSGGYRGSQEYEADPLELVLVPVSMMPSPDAVGFGGDAEDGTILR